MDFDEGYIHQLTQKYRIAVAIAVLREKPENISTNEYITELKNTLNDDINDLDLTICSDDFDLDENNIINDVIHNEGVFDDTNNNNDNLYNEGKCLSNERCDNDKGIRKDARGNATCSQESLNLLNNILFENEFEPDKFEYFATNHSTAKEHDYTNVHQKNTAKDLQFNDPGSTFCETNAGVPTAISYSNQPANAIEQTAIISNEESKANTEHKEIIVFANEAIEINNIPINTYYDSQATEIYSLYGLTENTHYSQSQYDNIVINDKLLKSKNNNVALKNNTEVENNLEIVNTSKNQSLISKNVVINTKCSSGVGENKKLNENEIHTENAEKHQHVSKDQTQAYETQDMEIDEIFPQCGQDFNNVPIYEDINVNKIINSDKKYINKETDRRVEVNEGKNNSELNEEDSSMQINEENDISDDETQIVSFKVVEELNKIKNYISRRVERRMSNDGSMDSGYRSDSQTRTSGRNSLQPSGNWLNQSAHSLYTYITQCPLLATTQEIVSEIAQVLGQLIDNLQEEENYPSFLEELLENVDFLLRDVTDGDGEDIILKKDEYIQRLLLLNKSAHIQKYTIEKITKILENLQKNLSNPDETYEITHISEIENMSYVFHILEAILQRYVKVKDAAKEITNSPNELKKSSISDIWRRKWNPNYKEDSLMQDLSQKKCVLLSCNEVLNKLVVTCIDGYSLIAFSALQCFNLLQI